MSKDVATSFEELEMRALAAHVLAALAPTTGGLGIVVWERSLDDDLVASAKPLIDDFWALVESGVPPALDGSDDASETLDALYPQASGESVALADGTAALCREYVQQQATVKEAETAAALTKQRIQEVLGTATSGTFDGGKVRWNNVKGRTTVDAAKLKDEHPEVYSAVVKVGEPGRQFAVKVRE